MVVVFEFLSDDPLDNIITPLNFKVDKVVYFGYHNSIEEQEKKIRSLLKEYCDVRSCDFRELSAKNLMNNCDKMRAEIKKEQEAGNEVYCDITGGDELALVAFGRISVELKVPIHMFELPSWKLLEFDEGAEYSISGSVERRNIKYGLDMHVGLYGAKVNYKKRKDEKDLSDEEYRRDVQAIAEVYFENMEDWGRFLNYLHNDNKADVIRFNEMMDRLADAGILRYAVNGNRKDVKYLKTSFKDCLQHVGTILELTTLMDAEKRYSDVRVGESIDWDGVIHDRGDVYNEIDVIGMDGYTPVFISCKNGQLLKRDGNGVTDNGYLEALYELNTVAHRLGGKYAKKVLVTWVNVTGAYLERAKEMGIEIHEPK